MEERSTGIILRTHPLTETSLIVQWITPDLGRIACVARGARRPKSSFAGKLDLFFEVDFSFRRSRSSALHQLREAILLEPHAALRRELWRSELAAYCAVLVQQVTETETPLPEVYDLLRVALHGLCREARAPSLVFEFELKLLQVLGYGPDWSTCSLSAAARSAGQWLANRAPGLEGPALDGPAGRELSRFLAREMASAFERIPAQRARALRSVGAE